MSVELRVPSMGESVRSGIVARWLKAEGDAVAVDEPVVAIDSDKATVEIPSPVAGRLQEQAAKPGDEVAIGQVVARIAEGAAQEVATPVTTSPATVKAGPAARAALREAGVEAGSVTPTGRGGRVTRADVEAAADRPRTETPPDAGATADEEVVPMSAIRRRIAERLVEAQQTAAMLTTFNEVDLGAVMALRERWQERFQKRYGVKLGFMSFFVKAAIDALKAFPSANAEIRGTDIVYRRRHHIAVAVSSPRGLVVPVLRDADRLSFAETEQAIAALGEKARNNQISVDDLRGGTFTISNGGVFGSLLSTPILNPPQVAILGMHAIQKRAVVRDDQVVIRPMMYLAVTYDHRLLDGREAVGFLVRIKECVEDPERMLIEV
jgi:2-oxoglutarate dehydrogenase E2 component (dihydrolipoamide succinyltransferase)